MPERPEPDPLVSSKTLKKLIEALRSRQAPCLLDLGPVVGSNVAYFGEQLGCRVIVADVLADVEELQREQRLAELPARLKTRFPQTDGTVDGVLCWDVFDFLDRPSAQVVATEAMRLMAEDSVLFGFFSTAHPAEGRFHKYVVVDDTHVRPVPYSTPRMRQAVLQNRDIIRLFERLRVSDSFLLHSNVREILFKRPSYLSAP